MRDLSAGLVVVKSLGFAGPATESTAFRKSIYSGLCQVLDAACRIFDLHWALMFFSWDLESQQVNSYLQLVGSSSLTKDQIRAPCIGSAES